MERGPGIALQAMQEKKALSSYFHALEKEMATHSSVLAWRIPGTAEPGGLQSIASDMTQHAYNEYFKGHSKKMRTYSETPEPGCRRRSETVTVPRAYTVNL